MNARHEFRKSLERLNTCEAELADAKTNDEVRLFRTRRLALLENTLHWGIVYWMRLQSYGKSNDPEINIREVLNGLRYILQD